MNNEILTNIFTQEEKSRAKKIIDKMGLADDVMGLVSFIDFIKDPKDANKQLEFAKEIAPTYYPDKSINSIIDKAKEVVDLFEERNKKNDDWLNDLYNGDSKLPRSIDLEDFFDANEEGDFQENNNYDIDNIDDLIEEINLLILKNSQNE